MRDATIDGRQVICCNASLLAGGTRSARVGHMVTCDYNGQTRLARVLGRIVHAPAIDCEGGERLENWLLVMMLSDDSTHAYERWIDPATVTRIFESPDRFAAFFFAPKLPYDLKTMRRLMDHGTMSESYIDNAPKHVARWKESSNVDKG